jgi:RNA polymerase sigma-70 factor, ECF subfamily
MNRADVSQRPAAAGLPSIAKSGNVPLEFPDNGLGYRYRRIISAQSRVAQAPRSNQFQRLVTRSPVQGEGLEDQALVRRFQQGERRVFNQLVVKYQHRMIRVIARLVPNRADAEDILQETFIRAYRALPHFRHDAAFYTWLFQIGINAAKNFLSIQKKRAGISVQLDSDSDERQFLPTEPIDHNSPQTHLESKQLVRAMLAAVHALPLDLATPLLLCEVDGMTYQHIAAVFDCPVGTIRSRIFRARERISEQIRPLVEQGTELREKRSKS